MELIRSNRTEALAKALVAKVRDQPLGPFQKEVVVVQSRGMERWLTLALSEGLGIWANPWFPFPRALIEWVLDKLDAGPSIQSKRFEKARLKWTVAELLRTSPPKDLQSYLVKPADEDRVLRLATAVTSVFDEYAMYRPDLLERWAEGEEEGWQSELWRRIVDRLDPHDLVTRIRKGETLLRSGNAAARIGLQRLHLFSLETLPPLFLQFFGELGRIVPTSVYSLEPSREFLGDVPAKIERATNASSDQCGHEFLSDVARLSRDFQQLLISVDDRVERRFDLFESPGRSSLLTSVQSDILEFKSRPRRDHRQVVDPCDPTISVHACTGPMREVQTLQDLIRGALEDDQDLRPEDIVVMTPDLDTYAPIFRAVFGERDPHRIPYEVHDRRTREDASFYDDFLAVLDVVDSRFSVLDVVRLMDATSMREDFQFTQDERARLADLLSAAGVRWGIDAEHRAELEFPKEELHTWKAGLERLFLGFSTMPDSVEVFQGLLPRGAPSLSDAELIARLSRLCEVLFDAERRTRQPMRLDAWADQLGRLCSFLFREDGDTGGEVRVLREALDDLHTLAEDGGYTGALSLKTVRRELGMRLVQETPAVGFLRRGVTFTDLVPLRSVPFKIVCLVGMREDAFPRADDRPRFDRTRDEHRDGDRNKRDDDRHSFLQAVLCARERLIITYSAPASSIRAGANPSPVVSELREAVRAYCVAEGEHELLETMAHPLHAFDPGCFSGEDLPRGFSQRYAKIALVVSGLPSAARSIELAAPAGESEPALSVGELTTWLWSPMSAFIDKVLRARFERAELYEPTGALTELMPLNASKIGNHALRAGLRARALDAFLKAAPELPDGSWGGIERRRLAREIEAVDRRERGLLRGEIAIAERFETNVNGTTVVARLDGLLAERRVVARFTKPGRKAELAMWIEHLLMQCTVGSHSRTTHLILRNGESRATVVSFAPVRNAREELGTLVRLYRTSREAPLPLIERASREFADVFEHDEAQAWNKARKNLESQRRWDERLEFVLGPEDPFANDEWAESFKNVALEVYGPLVRHRSER